MICKRSAYILLFIILSLTFNCGAQKIIIAPANSAGISVSENDSIVKPAATKVVADTLTGKEQIITVKPARDEYYSSDYMRYEDFIYKENIKTINLSREGFRLSSPVYDINTNVKLILSFDDLDGDYKNYKFYYIHCDADWKPSVINDNEFMTGFNDDFITDYRHSYSTRQLYTHYELSFPNDNTNIITSGNYLLVVYLNDNKEDIAFTRRFWVVEPKVSINATIKAATKLEDRNYKQEIDFTVTKNSYIISNPYSDLKVNIMQNGRSDNMLHEVKPQVVKDDIIDYNFNGEITFNGGNEFRRFDIKSLRYNSERINTIYLDSITKKYVVVLFKDARRPFQQYLKEPDINGKFLIKDEDNASNSDIEGEYVWVHFTLPYASALSDGDIYILGALTDWRFEKSNKMYYDLAHKAYAADLYLKQGYYNYQYVFLPNGEKTGDETLIEGNHFETENEYTIFIYFREPGSTFDKLIGLKQLNSTEF